MSTPERADSGPPPIRWPLRVGAGLVGVEGVVLAGYAGWVGISTVAQPPEQPGLAAATIGLLLVVGVGLAVTGWRLWQGHGRLRALAVAAQLFIGVLGYDYLGRGVTAGGVGLLVAVVIIVLLVVPSSTAVLAHRVEEPTESSND